MILRRSSPRFSIPSPDRGSLSGWLPGHEIIAFETCSEGHVHEARQLNRPTTMTVAEAGR